jgi:hypothetical protein
MVSLPTSRDGSLCYISGQILPPPLRTNAGAPSTPGVRVLAAEDLNKAVTVPPMPRSKHPERSGAVVPTIPLRMLRKSAQLPQTQRRTS